MSKHLDGTQGHPVLRFLDVLEAGLDDVADSPVWSLDGADAAAATTRTRIERAFEPRAVRALKDSAERDLSIGGPTLAAHAFGAGLVDEVAMFVSPVAVGGGTRFLPAGIRLDLELMQERRFGNGVVFARYRVAR